jgi:cyanate lyase
MKQYLPNQQPSKFVRYRYIRGRPSRHNRASDLNDKIIEVVGKKGLTHLEVARLAHTSRTRVTAILNRNTHGISTDLMLRVLGSLGVQAKLQFKRAA